MDQKQLFEIARFNVIQAGLSNDTKDYFSQGYLFAWAKRIFPFDKMPGIHNAFEEKFSIRKDRIDGLLSFIDDQQRNHGKKLTFYELESSFAGRSSTISFTQTELRNTLRYLWLDSLLDDQYANHVVSNCPMQFRSLNAPFKMADDISFFD